jgi:hypothetical protein
MIDSLQQQVTDLKRHVQLALYVANLEADPNWQADVADLHDRLPDGTANEDQMPEGLLEAYLEADKNGERPSDYISRLRRSGG